MPTGHRFCLLHGDPPRVDVSFYTMLKEGKPMVTLLKTMEKKTVNEVRVASAVCFCLVKFGFVCLLELISSYLARKCRRRTAKIPAIQEFIVIVHVARI